MMTVDDDDRLSSLELEFDELDDYEVKLWDAVLKAVLIFCATFAVHTAIFSILDFCWCTRLDCFLPLTWLLSIATLLSFAARSKQFCEEIDRISRDVGNTLKPRLDDFANKIEQEIAADEGFSNGWEWVDDESNDGDSDGLETDDSESNEVTYRDLLELFLKDIELSILRSANFRRLRLFALALAVICILPFFFRVFFTTLRPVRYKI